ncbi:TetR/AcrR family transcriptional regulator [Streptomyces sp. NPDC029216]|uniref:TetR/AcrR family transcriptional regulator n=1 Tax=Streptomyces sp. NPDC029216 TaxID=3154701 RepID=UPI0033EF76F5
MFEPTAETSGSRVDPRVLRTRALLRTAALELASERDADTITMADIAERATVNRATVYQHYKDRDELLLAAMEGEISGLARAAARCPLAYPPDRMPAELVELFRHVESNATLYQRMLGPTGTARFVNRLRDLIADEVTAQLSEPSDRPAGALPADLRAHYLAGAVVGLITQWLTRADRLSAEAVAAVAWEGLRRAS